MKLFKRNRAIVIVSVNRKDRSEYENARAFELAHQYLDTSKVPYVVGQGYYDGVHEPVLCTQYGYGSFARELAEANEQDCILYVDAGYVAEYGHRENGYKQADDPVGLWRNIPDWEARQSDAWTEISGRFYKIVD